MIGHPYGSGYQGWLLYRGFVEGLELDARGSTAVLFSSNSGRPPKALVDGWLLPFSAVRPLAFQFPLQDVRIGAVLDPRLRLLQVGASAPPAASSMARWMSPT